MSLERILKYIETSVIAAGAIAAFIVLWRYHEAAASRPAPDAEREVLVVHSACDPGVAPDERSLVRAWLDGAELPAEPTAPEPKLDDAMRARGAHLFAEHCTACHGTRGAGDGPVALQLAVPPANLTSGVYALRTTEHEALPTDTDLFRTITRGIHGTAMPPWFALPERDRWALVAHLKTLSSAFADDEAPPPIAAVPPAPTRERLEEGARIYQSGGCSSCHGTTGRGDGLGAASLTYANGAPFHPRNFIAGRFHRSSRLPDIYMTLASGLDGTPMASFAKVLTPDQLWDAAMYVHSLAPRETTLANGLRCGRVLAPDPDELVGVRVLQQSLHATKGDSEVPRV